jgi:membrane-bound metal-dependent hydrolase YbcI (DUF457 family)
MYAIGHFAVGYLLGKGSSKLLKTKISLPLLLMASVLPDIDLILERVNYDLFMHRGPTHSFITLTVLMIPFFVFYRKKAVPYYVALLSHSLIGDLFTGGIELFWPISSNWFAALHLSVNSVINVSAELSLFFIALAIMYKAKDLQTLLEPNHQNYALIVAGGAALGPLLSTSGGFESSLPLPLVAPSLFWIVLFAYSLYLQLRFDVRKRLLNGRGG